MHVDVGCCGAPAAVWQQLHTRGNYGSGDHLSLSTRPGDVVGSLLDQYGPRMAKIALLYRRCVHGDAGQCLFAHALLSSQLSVAAVWHASERLLAAVERRCRPCMTTDRAEVLRRMLVRAMLSYTVRYRTAHIDASKPTLGCQRRMLMFELLD